MACNHDNWGKWEPLLYYERHMYIQKRYCKHCGLGQVRNILITKDKKGKRGKS